MNDAGDARSGLECATWSICVDLTISVVLSQCCTDGCTDACTTPSQGCTGPAIRLCPHAIAIVAMLVGDKH